MKLFSTNDLKALELVLSQIKDFPSNKGRYRRGYVIISNDEYFRFTEIRNLIKSEIEIREEG